MCRELVTLMADFADEAATMQLCSMCFSVPGEDPRWHDTSNLRYTAENSLQLERCMRYLDLRGLLERHSEHSWWVRINDRRRPLAIASTESVENIREGDPYDDPAFEALAREHDVWGRADGALCAVFWLAGKAQPSAHISATDAEQQRAASIARNYPFSPVIGEAIAQQILAVESHQEGLSIIDDVMSEVERATRKFPTWPTDPLHALAVLGEEYGELNKAMLQLTYEPHKSSLSDVRAEAIQTAAMSLRLLMSLGRYEYRQCGQHQQQMTAGQEE